MTAPLRAVCIVIPTHNEEALIGACLRSVIAAVTRAQEVWPMLRCSVTVVLDSCTDASAHVAQSIGGVDTLAVQWANVGQSRSSGVAAAAARHYLNGGAEHIASESIWIANTDADSHVPVDWVLWHLAAGNAGADVLTGTVVPLVHDVSQRTVSNEPTADDLTITRWCDAHDLVDGHPYVHGANLGFRYSRYCSVGGFAELTCSEDVELVQSLLAAGACHVASAATPVATSARLTSRCTGGFADYLRAVDVTPASAPALR